MVPITLKLIVSSPVWLLAWEMASRGAAVAFEEDDEDDMDEDDGDDVTGRS